MGLPEAVMTTDNGLDITSSNFSDVKEFHKKFELLWADQPRHLTYRKLRERLEFLFEEFSEFANGCGVILVAEKLGPLHHPDEAQRGQLKYVVMDEQDILEQADALVDLVYVAMGTAVMLGLPWEALWADVHAANMRKERGISKRGHKIDVIKPSGWVGPKTDEILYDHGYDFKVDQEHHDDQQQANHL